MLFSAIGKRRAVATRVGSSGIQGTLVAVTYLSGSGTFTPQANTRALFVRVIGGGGAGGGAANSNNTGSGGAGGNAGAYLELALFTGSLAYVYSVGAGGTGVSGGTGNTGTDTIFGPFTAQGGTGGTAGVSLAAPNIRRQAVGAVQSTTVGATLFVPTAVGAAGKNHGTNAVQSGAGANSALGSGGHPKVVDGNGNAGTGFGSGGGGAVTTTPATNRTGGAGRVGTIIVEEYV